MKAIIKKLILATVVGMLALAISGCGAKDEDYRVSNQDSIILRLAETQAPGYPSSRAAKEFARLVEEKSAGRIKVKVYDSGRLGDETSVVEQVQFGGIDLARVSVASLARYYPRMKAATLPFIFTSPYHVWWVFEGTVGEEVKEGLLKEKITCLVWYEGGARAFYNSKKRITEIEDLKGLRISARQSQTMRDLYSSIGISLAEVKPSEVYSALQTGIIDGAEDNVVAYYVLKHYEVAPFLTYDEHTRIPEAIIASRITMLQLSKHDQAIIEQAAKESAFYQRKLWTDMEKDAWRFLRETSVVITYGSEASRAQFLLTAKPYFDGFNQNELDALSRY
jgi:tripartite ATP-independent transporter DctP family solute receptor